MWDDFGIMAEDDLCLRRMRFQMYMTGEGVSNPTSGLTAGKVGGTDGRVTSTVQGVERASSTTAC